MKPSLHPALELMLVTDGRGDLERITAIAAAAVDAGVRAVQVREPKLSARAQADLCCDLRALLDRVGGLLLVNDRADVAGTWCHGVHLGRRSVRPSQARALLGDDAVIGFSAHDVDEVLWAAGEGADYVTVSPVFATTSKPGAVPLGVMRAQSIAVRSPLPAVWLGGIDAERLRELLPMAPFGVAVMSAICAAEDPGAAAALLLERLESGTSR